MFNLILEKIFIEYKELFQEMKNSTHHYSDIKLNPYHLEGDVFTHTMMVLSNAMAIKANNNVLLACLLHDIGKPKTREVKEDTQRVRFFQHENVSTVLAIDILNYIENSFKDFNFNKENVLKLINMHSFFHTLGKYDDYENFSISKKEEQKINEIFSKDLKFYEDLITMNYCDNKGRISLDENEMKFQNKFNFLRNYIPYHKVNMGAYLGKPQAIMAIGLPASGKSTYLQKYIDEGYVIISSDYEIQKKYPNLSYNDAYNKVQEKDEFNGIEILLLDKLKEAVNNRKNIILDRTFLTKKSRRKYISYIPYKYYEINAITFFTPLKDIKERNILRSRDGKHIPEKVYDFMIKNFTIPTKDEGFHNISFNFNTNKQILKKGLEYEQRSI